MPLSATRRTGLVEQVIGQLRDAITGGEWPVGHRIPTEPELAASLNVGRNTVREAVRALMHSGLLEVRQGDGTYVRATSEVSGAIHRLCGSELREALEVRRTLEVEGARLAAIHHTPEELREMTELLDERDAARHRDRFEEFVRTDAAFHTAVVRSAHNTLLTELYHGLTEVVRGSVAATSPQHTAPGHDIEHRGLLNAIAERDPERAAAEARGFLDELLAGIGDRG
ncbi:FadR family transcriptional regulator [Haloechinothrix sp. YIM 98757]|uniref:FadR family transcriptional regulator n=1 Tax=Haloechinothrix aidingensis TaxID=2752311 RepID=A0A838ABM0_9PSEU|nr:FadR family transcriptional regulator [Haloechinothrix aidingensis]